MTTPLRSDSARLIDADDLPTPEVVPDRRQPGTRVEVFVDGTPDPFELLITNRERIAYEKACTRHKDWPAMQAGQHFAMTHVTWSAARRADRTSLTFDQWQEALLDWNVLSEEPADPTR